MSRLSPIPQDPIGENFKWREWFRNLGSYIQSGKSTYGAFSNSGNITFATANVAKVIPFTTTDYSNNMSVSSGKITVSESGLYNYQFSLQLANPDTSIHNLVLWLRKNGTDIPGTASKFDCPAKHGSVDGYLIAACNFFVDITDGDYVEMVGVVDSTTLYLEGYTAQTTPFVRPSIPSVVATLSYVSAK